ncbi:MAG TPA: Asp-tRNA(Asn)/Glu-tRNA(Gln) amidotransferase subunit GatC [Steroidobacteraceae bacterium]|jgi:aspartyl-tRNA(Asn)/glutamyl-tRNA(Gln) amidotransferase subunit C
MSLNRRDIENIAYLARLALTENEIPVYVESLSRIMALVGELERADTSQVEPMAHPLPGQRQRLRADVVSATDQHQLYQSSAPQVQAGLYLVPRVIE